LRRLVLWLVVFVTCVPLLKATITLDTDKVKKIVVFIYAAKNGGQVDTRRSLGTGFLVMIPRKDNPAFGPLLLVTARHIVDPQWAYCAQPDPTLIYLRLNKKNYDPAKDATGVDYVPVTLVNNGQLQYAVSDDSMVDAAVMPLDGNQVSQSKYDFAPMGVNVFASQDEIAHLMIGDSIASAGLIPGYPGEKRNYPFFKFGSISSIPDEPTWVSCEPGTPALRLERVWFIAANLVQGNSGSPIFYFPMGGGGVMFGGPINRPVLVGLQSESFAGADIAGMTPAEDIFKIIEKHAGPYADLYRGNLEQRPKQ
jgi:hypothetical protein